MLDLGSTSFTLLVADVTRQGVIRPVVREKVMLRLGAVIAARDKLPSATARRVVEVARQLEQVAAREKVQLLLPVATSALREARNGRKVAEKIGKAVGEPVRILEGEAEARLIRECVQQALTPHREALLRRGPTRIVAAGGTARTLARMLAAQRGEGSFCEAMPLALESDELRTLVERLLRSSHAERLAMPGMRRRRADLLPTGALVILSVAELLEIEDFILCDWGLREGVLLDSVAPFDRVRNADVAEAVPQLLQ